MRKFVRGMAVASVALVLLGCGPSRDDIRAEIEQQVRREAAVTNTVEVTRESLKPCPAKRPARPLPMGDLPTDAMQLIAALGAKLKEYAGEGMYADKAELYFDTCPPEGG